MFKIYNTFINALNMKCKTDFQKSQRFVYVNHNVIVKVIHVIVSKIVIL